MRKAKTVRSDQTWEQVVPVLIAIVKNGDRHGDARGGLIRLAKIADAYIARSTKAKAKAIAKEVG